MRFLHTSDWHLGHQLMNRDRKKEHQGFLSWLIDTINENKIDVLIIAGDIFDSCVPPNYAQQMYFNFLSQIHLSYCENVIITGGNHDSISQLEAPKSFLKYHNIHVIGGIDKNIDEQIIPIYRDNDLKAVVCAVPYLRDKDIRSSVAGESIEDKEIAYRQGLVQYYKEVYNRAVDICGANKDIPIIATGHLFMTGSQLSESERDLYIGGLGEMSSKDLDDFDYTALGHLHTAQKVGSSEKVRYSGSPIPLSFNESKQDKQVIIIDFENGVKTDLITIPVFQELKLIKGKFDEIIKTLMEYPVSDIEKSHWLEIEIEGSRSDFHQEKIEEIVKNKPLDILAIKYKKLLFRSSEVIDEDEINEITPTEVFNQYIQSNEENLDIDKKALSHAFKEILSSISN